ncbi:MAG TPA: oligosaccharide flippase family protein [Chloroflexota bacterium]|nr:oligosaccharide flippase family protein [Chloroflexota bacterium]
MSVQTQEAVREEPTQGLISKAAEFGHRLVDMLPSTHGAFWVLFAMATPKVLGPIFTIGLRRFLGPGASGLFDESMVPYNFFDNFRNFGTGPALVFERQVSRQVANTAWTLNMIFAAIVTAALEILAPQIALFFHHPEIVGLLRILAIGYLFASAASVHSFLLMRDLDFRARAVPPIGQVIVAGDLSVLFAVWGFGVGSLVARQLASVIMGTILLWAVYPYRPTLEFVPRIAWRLFKYGFWIGAGLTVLYMSQNVDVFIGSHVISDVAAIGFYTTSWKLAFIAASVFTLVASSMVFPTLSRLRDDIVALRVTLLGAIRQLGLVMFPAAALLAAVAPVLIVPILGTKFARFQDQYLVLTLLAVYAGNRTMLSIFFEGYKSIGKPWLVWAYNAVKLAIMAPAMYFGAQHGILGLALTYIPIQIIEFPVALILAWRVLGVSPAQVARSASVPVISTLVMAGAVVAVELALTREMQLGATVTLGLCLIVGALVYVGSLLVLDRRIIVEARRTLLKGF